MRVGIKLFVVVLAVCMLTSFLWVQTAAAQQTFKHPGVMLDRAQLDYMKAMVSAHVEPFYSTFLKAQGSTWGSLDYVPYGPPASDGIIKCGPTSNPDIGCKHADDDSSAAYLQALLWYITGNHAYADKAIAILNLYGYGLKGYATGSTYSNGPLQAAWDAEKFPRAAEIIRYTDAGWSDADIQAFGNMLNTTMLPLIKNGSSSNGNWEISMIEGMIGIGVFNDDYTTFNTGVTYWRQRIPAYFYYHTDGSKPVPAPRGTASWYGQTVFDATVDGISQETCRDFGHAQYGLAGSLNAAETAHIQGIDLYSEEKNRLVAALEFNAYYLSGNPIPTSVCGGAPTLQVYPIDEIGYNEYHNRLGLGLPYTLSYLNSTIRQLADPTENHMMVYESLSHGGDASNMPPFLFWSTPDNTTVWAGKSATYTVNLVPGSDPSAVVTLGVTGLPNGATYSFDPPTLTGASAAALTVTTAEATQAGVYPFTVTGTSGSESNTEPLNLTVNPEAADFSLSATPDLTSTVVGDTSAFTVKLIAQSGYIGGATLSVSGLPDGATAAFTPATVSATNPVSTLSILTAGSTTPGSYTLTISANDQTLVRSTTAVLIVNPISTGCIQQLGNYWLSGVLPTQTAVFTAEWDASPSTTTNNSNVGLSFGEQEAFTGLALAARFNTTGTIDARNGGAFAADTTVPYSAGVTYHFRAVVDVPANKYSIYVTPAGQSEITLGTNYAFRTEQTGITSIDHWEAISQAGTIALCNLTVNTNDFSVSTSPSTQTITAGETTTFNVSMESGESYSGSVNLSVSGLPDGATGSFSPSTLSGNSSSALTITTNPSAAAGVYPLTITANDGATTRVSYIGLTIAAACQPPVATTQNMSAPVNGVATIMLTGSVGAFCNSTDTLTYTITSQPIYGTLEGTAPNLTYTPEAGYVGTDRFLYTVSDANATPADSRPSLVMITVAAASAGLPKITGLSPALSTAGSTGVTITVYGNGFVSGSTVRWNGQDLSTTFVSATQLTAAIPAADLTSAGTADITVFVPGANGGASAPMKFAIDTSASTSGRPTVTSASGTLSVVRGKNASVTLTLANVGSNMQTTVACYNLPVDANCSYNSGTKTVTVTTGTDTPMGSYQVLVVCTVSPTQTAFASHMNAMGLFYGIFLAPFGLFMFGNRRKKTIWLFISCLSLLLLLTCMIGCGGGGNSPKTPPQSNGGGQASTTVTLMVS